MLLFLGATLFSGCKETQPAEPEVKPATASPAQAFLETLAPVFGKTAKDIEPLAFSGVWMENSTVMFFVMMLSFRLKTSGIRSSRLLRVGWKKPKLMAYENRIQSI